jgi:hypothetical protein
LIELKDFIDESIDLSVFAIARAGKNNIIIDRTYVRLYNIIKPIATVKIYISRIIYVT